MAIEQRLDELTALVSDLRSSRGESLQSKWRFDNITRQLAELISNTVPVICSDDEIPADVYFGHPGAGLTPAWLSVSLTTTDAWDSTDKRFYKRLGSGPDVIVSGLRAAWPTGLCGEALSFTPKITSVTSCVFEFRGRFNANADYTIYGIGLHSDPGTSGSANPFNTGHFIQVLRNGSSWELGTRDGSTTSQSSGGTADGDLHDFKVVWTASSVVLYVDAVSTITKTTNMPTEPLAFLAVANDATNTIDVMGIKITWA